MSCFFIFFGGLKGVGVGGGNKKSLIGINWKVEKQSMRNRL